MTHHGNRIETKLIARKSQQLIGQLSNYFAYVRKVYNYGARKAKVKAKCLFQFHKLPIKQEGT